MPEPTQIMFEHRELVELMLKKQGIHEGVWGLSINFGMKASNVGSSLEAGDMMPTALIPVLAIGIARFDKESNIAVDAARVNPNPAPKNAGQMRPRHKH